MKINASAILNSARLVGSKQTETKWHVAVNNKKLCFNKMTVNDAHHKRLTIDESIKQGGCTNSTTLQTLNDSLNIDK